MAEGGARSRSWYVVRDGAERGPVTAQRIREWAASGQLRPTDLVRRGDMPEARPASSVRGLFPDGAGGKPYDVFVSHSHKDKSAVDAIVHVLEARGIRCWIAPRDILPGAAWGEAIIRAMDDCRVLVLVLTEHSNASRQILQEVERGVAKGLTIVPFRIEDVPVSPSLELYVGAHHWLDAFTAPLEQHIEALADALKRIVSGSWAGSAAPSAAAAPREAPPDRRRSRLLPLGLAGVVLAGVAAGVAWWLTRDSDGGSVEAREPATEVAADPGRPEVAPPVERASSASPAKAVAAEPEPEPVVREEQRVALLAALAPGHAYEAIVTVPNQVARRAVVACVARDGDGLALVLEVSVPEDAHQVVAYRGGLVALESPTHVSRGGPTVQGWTARFSLDRELVPPAIQGRGPLGGEELVLVPGGEGGLEGRTAGGRSFVLAPGRRTERELVTIEALLEDLAPGRAFEGTTEAQSGSSRAVTMVVAELDVERRYVRLQAEPTGEPWMPQVLEGSIVGDDAPVGWPVRLTKLGAARGRPESALLGPGPDSVWLRREGDEWLGLVGRAAQRVRLADAGRADDRVVTAARLATVTEPGTRWDGRAYLRNGETVEFALTFLESAHDGGRVRTVLELDDPPGHLAAYNGSFTAERAAVGAWPVRLTKAQYQERPYGQKETMIFDHWARELLLRPVGDDRMVGWSVQVSVELDRSDDRLSVELLGESARARTLAAFRRGERYRGRATVEDQPPVRVDMEVVEGTSDGAHVLLRFTSKESKHVPEFEGSLVFDDVRGDTWPLKANKKQGFPFGPKGMFGNLSGSHFVILRVLPSGALEGWCGPERIELEAR